MFTVEEQIRLIDLIHKQHTTAEEDREYLELLEKCCNASDSTNNSQRPANNLMSDKQHEVK